MTHLTVISKTKKLKMVQLTNVTLTWAARSSTMNFNKNLFLGTVQCLDKSFCRNTFHSTSSTTTVKIKISGESIQKEFQIMIMKKFLEKKVK